MDLILLVLEVQNVYSAGRLFCLLSVLQSLFIKSQQKTNLVFVFCKHNEMKRKTGLVRCP